MAGSMSSIANRGRAHYRRDSAIGHVQTWSTHNCHLGELSEGWAAERERHSCGDSEFRLRSTIISR